jgi:hypothetical protein
MRISINGGSYSQDLLPVIIAFLPRAMAFFGDFITVFFLAVIHINIIGLKYPAGRRYEGQNYGYYKKFFHVFNFLFS